MSKIMALDLGDQWVGIAISDASRMFARPYTTVAAPDLESLLAEAITQEKVDLIIVGHPITMKGGESQQTKKILTQKKSLEE